MVLKFKAIFDLVIACFIILCTHNFVCYLYIVIYLKNCKFEDIQNEIELYKWKRKQYRAHHQTINPENNSIIQVIPVTVKSSDDSLSIATE